MARLLTTIVAGCAAYGFAMGSIHSLTLARNNAVKFPALIFITAAVCALAYYVLARIITRRLSFAEMQTLSLKTFRDISLLLGSLSPLVLFLAWVVEQPDYQGHLNEYPFFLGLNVLLIALCGTTSLVRRGIMLIRRHELTLRHGVLVMAMWLSVSLFVGGQVSWWFRPVCGISTIPDPEVPFILGARPDFRGDTSFYMAVYHLLKPPQQTRGYRDVRW